MDLLYGAMLPSGNDAAFTLAEYIGYLLLDATKTATIVNPYSSSLDLTKVTTSLAVQGFLKCMNNKAK